MTVLFIHSSIASRVTARDFRSLIRSVIAAHSSGVNVSFVKVLGSPASLRSISFQSVACSLYCFFPYKGPIDRPLTIGFTCPRSSIPLLAVEARLSEQPSYRRHNVVSPIGKHTTKRLISATLVYRAIAFEEFKAGSGATCNSPAAPSRKDVYQMVRVTPIIPMLDPIIHTEARPSVMTRVAHVKLIDFSRLTLATTTQSLTKNYHPCVSPGTAIRHAWIIWRV